MAARRAGQLGQIDAQGRSHATPDCGSYRLLERLAPNRWLVQWVAPCDQHPEALRTSTLQFISRAEYDRYF